MALESGTSISSTFVTLPLEQLRARLSLGKQLGRGAFAVVYSANLDGQPVALKVLMPQYVGGKDEKDTLALKMFFCEVSTQPVSMLPTARPQCLGRPTQRQQCKRENRPPSWYLEAGGVSASRG